MQFHERTVGDYRIYAGALEGPLGDGYIAAAVVVRLCGAARAPREVYRDDIIAGGHRWESADAAIAYALTKAEKAIQSQPPVATTRQAATALVD